MAGARPRPPAALLYQRTSPRLLRVSNTRARTFSEARRVCENRAALTWVSREHSRDGGVAEQGQHRHESRAGAS